MSKKNRIPKKVAGFKVPKSIRKSKPLKAMLASKTGRDILGKVLMAGAAAAAAVLAEERDEVAHAGKKGAGKGARAIGIAGDAMQSAAHAAMGVVTDLARSYLPQTKDEKRSTRQPREEAKEDRPFASSATH
ncbi:hypothetical protein ABID21_003411 [Pseudorhizobium tarimense]|uniref:Uncharacterized protein n=1 Tax=Pseudorhizobium tarimense TaxID=1079109 RepID=A0ABV2HAP7_9HYPH|nr:hypothetical protein [Pseudorhizobium tarimense]MCJ8520386.1 hypothetical protein [Pseudorhizobium tarimense]